MSQQSLEQKRAAHALVQIKAMHNDAKQSGYRSYVSSFPASILMNGLGQASAQLLAQAKDENDAHQKLYDHLESWVCREREIFGAGQHDLIDAITNSDQAAYVRAQAEALKYLEWLKKFARAYLATKGS